MKGDEGKTVAGIDEVIKSQLECPLCFGLFAYPITTICGHSFCGPCLRRLQSDTARAAACPICRHPIWPAGYRVNRTLSALLEALLPQESAQRQAEAAESTALLRRALPLFEAEREPLMPSTPTTLYLYEARYVAMARHALSLELPAYGHLRKGDSIGTLALVETYHVQPNGHYFVRARGSVRFRVLSRSRTEAGYVEAEVELLPHDAPASRLHFHSTFEEQEGQGTATEAAKRTTVVTEGDREFADGLFDAKFSALDWLASPTNGPNHSSDNGSSDASLRTMAFAVVSEVKARLSAAELAQLDVLLGPWPTDVHLASFWLAAALDRSGAQRAKLLAIPDTMGRYLVLRDWVQRDQARARPLRRANMAFRWLLVLLGFLLLFFFIHDTKEFL